MSDDEQINSPYTDRSQAVEEETPSMDQVEIKETPATVPTVITSTSHIKSQSGCLLPAAIMAAAILIAASNLIGSGGGNASPDRSYGNDSVTDIDAGSLKSCSLIVIADDSLASSDVGYAMTLQDDEFWDGYCSETFRDTERLDDDDRLAKAFLESTGQTQPIVFLLNANKKALWIMPLPKSGTDKIKEKINESK